MVIEDASQGAARNNTIILGSGLSGMVAAYIAARAMEDDAAQNEHWSAQQVIRFHLPRRLSRPIRPGGTGAAFVS